MEAFTYENIYYDECTERHNLFVLPPVSKRTKTREYVFRMMSASGLMLCLIYIYFIKEISPLQRATTYELNGFDGKILDMSIRCSRSSWGNDLPGSSYANNITDWSFKTTYITCPVIESLTPKYTRKKHELKCDDCKGTICYVTTGNTSDIFTIPFNNMHLTKCLGDVIDHCCRRKGTAVPNVVHYAWHSYKQFGCFSFLRFMSLMRFIKPCLTLINGRTLASGTYRDYFIQISPNFIHVRSESSEV